MKIQSNTNVNIKEVAQAINLDNTPSEKINKQKSNFISEKFHDACKSAAH